MLSTTAASLVRTDGLFEKPPISQRSETGSSASNCCPEATGSTPTGNFLDRLFPSGDFLDGIAAAAKGRCSFYKPPALGACKAAEVNARPRPVRPQSPTWMAHKPTVAVGPQQPKARERQVPNSSSGASSSLHSDTRNASPQQVRQELKSKSSKDAETVAEDRRARIRERQAEQAQYETSLKSSAQLKAEHAAKLKADARAARIRERQQQQQATGCSSGSVTGGGGDSAVLTEEEAAALREREMLRHEKTVAMLQKEVDAAAKVCTRLPAVALVTRG